MDSPSSPFALVSVVVVSPVGSLVSRSVWGTASTVWGSVVVVTVVRGGVGSTGRGSWGTCTSRVVGSCGSSS